jgi:hypothetical protein
MELNIRTVLESDWDMLVDWWANWADWGVNPSKDMLPGNGTGGLIIEKNNKPIMAGFLYLTNSKVAWMEFIVSDPAYKENDRAEALQLLILSLEDIAREMGKEIILSIGRNKSLLKMHESLGYTIDKDPSYEISKNIKL